MNIYVSLGTDDLNNIYLAKCIYFTKFNSHACTRSIIPFALVGYEIIKANLVPRLLSSQTQTIIWRDLVNTFNAQLAKAYVLLARCFG